MQIDLSGETALYIQSLVVAGEYRTASEAVAEGVRLLKGRQQLRADIQQGVDELNAGQGIEGESVFAELRARSKPQSEQAE